MRNTWATLSIVGAAAIHGTVSGLLLPDVPAARHNMPMALGERISKPDSCSPSDQLDLVMLHRELAPLPIDFAPTMPSTNDRALQLARSPQVQLPLLVLTEQQTRGRGQQGRAWYSAAGSLTFSLLLEAPPAGSPLVSLAAGAGICRALEQAFPDAPLAIKWPNDVLLQGRKLAGVLVEVTPAERVVIGCGVNVNVAIDQLHASVSQRAISIAQWKGAMQRMNSILVALVRQTLAAVDVLRRDPQEIIRYCREKCCLRGRTIEVRQGSSVFRGRFLEIDSQGAMRLERNGEERTIRSGRIVALPADSF